MTGIGMTSARTRDRLIARLREQGIANPLVLERIRSVPRHVFMDEALASRAYEDTALPIGHGQTISQPYIVARMTEALLEGGTPRKVLEVGTGCGYQTAVLAPLVTTVYSVERIAALQVRARRVLRDLRIANVFMRHGDGFEGWPPYAPYDGILVAAAATRCRARCSSNSATAEGSSCRSGPIASSSWSGSHVAARRSSARCSVL